MAYWTCLVCTSAENATHFLCCDVCGQPRAVESGGFEAYGDMHCEIDGVHRSKQCEGWKNKEGKVDLLESQSNTNNLFESESNMEDDRDDLSISYSQENSHAESNHVPDQFRQGR